MSEQTSSDVEPKRGRARTVGMPRRKRGAPTLSQDVRECIINAFHELGGRDYLVWVGQRRPDVMCQLIGKIIPSEARLTVMAGYTAMPVPVEVREPIPGQIEANAALEALPGEPLTGEPHAMAALESDDWGL